MNHAPHATTSHVLVEHQLLPPTLAASWERSAKHGLRRKDHALFGDSLSRGQERRVTEQNNDLIARATPEMQRLFSLLGSAHWLALCLNTRGEVVHAVGNRTSAPRELRVLMRPGRLVVEAELGTTAPGCVLEDQRTIVVNRGEHYLHELRNFFCAGAPIFRPDGSLAGALDISGVDVEVLPLAYDMVGLAVRGIENGMVESMGDCVLMRFHCDERLLGTPFEGIMAVNREGSLVGANRAASRLLALGPGFGVGTRFDAIIDHGLEGILRRAHGNRASSLRLRSHLGSEVHFRVDRERSGLTPIPAVPLPRRQAPEPNSILGNGFVMLDERLVEQFRKARRLLEHQLPVLIEGETGTGKELFARALHAAARPDGPFVAVNCAAIPEGLIESELFGYVNGAFTGARRGGASGRIEYAHRGVLFLDEVGDMAGAVQKRLLRVLQERAVVRVGDNREHPVDILVVCATHHCLTELVADGRFREDLYYRLAGHTLVLPPLRERKDVYEILISMIRHRAAQLRLLYDSQSLDNLISPAALECLRAHRWPGNLRQLQNVIHVLLALYEPGSGPVQVSDLPRDVTEGSSSINAAVAAAQEASPLKAAKLAAVRRALQDHNGNIAAAARALGVSRSTVYSLLRRADD